MSSSVDDISKPNRADWIRFVHEMQDELNLQDLAYTNHLVPPTLKTLAQRAMFHNLDVAAFSDLVPKEEQEHVFTQVLLQKRLTEDNYVGYMSCSNDIDFPQSGHRFSHQWLSNWPEYTHIEYVINFLAPFMSSSAR